jgi:hypothetical protein
MFYQILRKNNYIYILFELYIYFILKKKKNNNNIYIYIKKTQIIKINLIYTLKSFFYLL